MPLHAIEGRHPSCPTGFVCRGERPLVAAPFRIAVDIDRTLAEEFVVADVLHIDEEHFCLETTAPADQLPTHGMVSIVGRLLAIVFRKIRDLGGKRCELVVVYVYTTREKPIVKVVDVNLGSGYVAPARLDEHGRVRRKELPIIEYPAETVQTVHVDLLPGVLQRIAGLSARDVWAILDAARRA